MQLSLAGWSLNPLFKRAGDPLRLLDFPAFARQIFDIDAVELNNIYFESTNASYLASLVSAAEKSQSKLLNIAVDEKGDLSALESSTRSESVAKYARWIPVAKEIGCTAIRANSGGKVVVDRGATIDACVDSFRRLADVGRANGVALLIENHGGISSDPAVMMRIARDVRKTHGTDAMHTLVDFGNWPDEVDRYEAIRQTMPFAGAVHAKINDIDASLNHPRFDHARCLTIARDAGYDGYLGIEFEGAGDCVEGVKRGASLLRRLLST